VPVVTRRKNIQVQLAKVYEPGMALPSHLYMEPKFDGLRGIIDVDLGVAYTRTGLPIPNAEKIIVELQKSGEFREMVLDGEFLADDWNLSQSIVKTQTLHPDIDSLKFYTFDLLSQNEWEYKACLRSLECRKQDLMRRWENSPVTPHVVYVEHQEPRTPLHLETIFKAYLKKGYEGAMLKDAAACYQFKKHISWLKYKPFHDGDFTIIGAVEGRGKHKGVLGALQIKGKVEKCPILCEVGTGFDDATRKQLWFDHKNNGLVGRIVEVEFQEITTDGALRFPSFRRMRDDK
jgi:DNA ligase-1